MDSTTIEAMHEQVRVIYRAATGSQLIEETHSNVTELPLEGTDIEQRFAELEALARTKPELTHRIPPFSFTPLVDVLEGQDELLIEVAVPGVEPADVVVIVQDDELTVSGVRRGACGSNGRTFVRAEIPRGPFKSVIQLPCPTNRSAEAQVQVERGIILIQLQKLQMFQPY
jgi:HSP20 family molecular chaperone IbpA